MSVGEAQSGYRLISCYAERMCIGSNTEGLK